VPLVSSILEESSKGFLYRFFGSFSRDIKRLLLRIKEEKEDEEGVREIYLMSFVQKEEF